ncbi:hypothetical protein WJ70_26980 [Burkholderia ubonensis]|nr:hypothetical protein WJ70_26980 [Burkholderia ubonensis]
MADFVREFAVGLIPFRLNDLTSGVDPIKFYEYRSLGVPVWSTNFGEMQQRGADDGVAKIELGCNWQTLWKQAQTDLIEPQAVNDFREAVSWKRRFQPILERVAEPRPTHRGVPYDASDASNSFEKDSFS